MSKKSFIVILILSIVVTYGVALMDATINISANKAGLPFKFGSYVLFGRANTDYLLLFLDIAFWFVIIWGVWKLVSKVRS